jgi:hypothetical protein
MSLSFHDLHRFYAPRRAITIFLKTVFKKSMVPLS